MTLSLAQDSIPSSVQAQPEPVLVIAEQPAELSVSESPLAVAAPETDAIAPEIHRLQSHKLLPPQGEIPAQTQGIAVPEVISSSMLPSRQPRVPSQQPSELTPELTTALVAAEAFTQQIGVRSSIVPPSPISSPIHHVEIKIQSAEGQGDDRASPPPSRIPISMVRQELRVAPGQVVSAEAIQQDLLHLDRLGLFSAVDAFVTQTPEGAIVTYELAEKTPSQMRFGAGTDQFIGVYGTVGYRNQEVGILGQQLDANLQVSTTADVQFLVSIANPYRRSSDSVGYRAYVFRDRVQANRLGGGFALHRPIGDWLGTISLDYARVTLQDSDPLGRPLSFSGNRDDDLLSLSLGMALDRRNHPSHPTQGWVLRLGTEQALPIGAGSVSSNRLRAGFVQYFALHSQKPDPMAEVLAIRLEAATALGELRPYWAFSPGDPSFVTFDRVRSYLLASVEYRTPLTTISVFGTSIPLGGVLFVDAGSDLGSSSTVFGRTSNRASGAGIGYGVGLRANSPFGLVRLDVGIGNQGDLRVQLGFGQRF